MKDLQILHTGGGNLGKSQTPDHLAVSRNSVNLGFSTFKSGSFDKRQSLIGSLPESKFELEKREDHKKIDSYVKQNFDS